MAHYYGAWVFLAALTIHVAIKLPVMIRAWRGRGVLAPLRADLEHTLAEPFEPGSLAPPQPAAPTISRRGLLGLVGSASAGLLVVTVGQSAGGPLRRLALLAPRGQGIVDDGPNGFAVNKTAATAGVTRRATGPDLAADDRRRRAARALEAGAAGDAAARARPADRLRGGMVDDPALEWRPRCAISPP